jgi:hypothetical protein
MFAGGKINMKSTKGTTMQSDTDMTVSNKGKLTLFSQGTIGIKSAGTVAISSQLGSWACSSELSFNGSRIQLNGGPKTEVATPAGLTKYLLPKVEFNAGAGWVAQPTGLESIVTRAPTHEPYPYHNQGVSVSVKLSGSSPTPPPDAPPVPEGVKITKTGDAATTAANTAAAVAPGTNTPQSLASQKAQYQSLNTQIHTLTNELVQMQQRGGNSNSIIALQDEIIRLQKQQDAIVAAVEAGGGSIADLY